MKINPSNILINDDGYICLTNLNGCIHFDDIETDIFNLNFVDNYTAPEILFRYFPGPWSDFYSVGRILLQLMMKGREKVFNIILVRRFS